MKIAFIGRVTLTSFSNFGEWNRPLPKVKWGFPLGSELVKGLVARGHDVHVITESGLETSDVVTGENSQCEIRRGEWVCQVGGAGLLAVHLVPTWKRSRWMFLTLFTKEVRGIRKIIEEIKPDVVFAQWTYYNAYAGLTSGYPTLVVAHDSPWRIAWIQKNLQSLIKAFYAQFWVFPRVKHMVAVSPYIADELQKWNRYKGELKVIPNGIKNYDDMPRTPIRKQATTVVCVADWSARKNVKTFFRAWSALKNFYSCSRAIVYGGDLCWEGAAGDWLRTSGLNMDGLDLRGQVSRDEIDCVLREEADLFVSPSLEESFGMVFVEAMRLGVPCVGGEKSGAVPWVMGEGGVVCDVTNPEMLAECIERVMGDYDLRKKLSEGGRRRAREMFDIVKVVDLYASELRRLVK